MSFIPKEHGAYGQLLFPLLTSMLVAGVSLGSLFFVVAVVAGFLVHEPLLVTLGLRGPRARREIGRAAVWWVVVLIILLVFAGVAAWRWMDASRRWTMILPLVPAVYLFIAAASGRGKSTAAEVAVAIAFSLVAVPLSLLGRPSIVDGSMVALAFATNFVLATLAVRVVIVKVRGGGDPRMVAAMRRSVYTLSIVVAAAAVAAAVVGWLPPLPLVSLVPGLVAALWIATNPPPPAKLRPVGWALVTTSAIVAILLIVTLRFGSA
jgi:hypothetical protein